MAEETKATETGKRARQRYFAVVKTGTTESFEVKTIEADTQNELKKELAKPDVYEIVAVTRGRKVTVRETRAVQFSF